MVRKNKNKKINSIKNKNILSDLDVENIILQTNEIISRLEKDKKKSFLFFKKKNLIDKQINDLKRFLDEEQYVLLKTKLEMLSKMENEEREKNLVKNEDNVKKEKKSIISIIKENDRWPIYTRVLNIWHTEEIKKNKIIKLSLLFSLILLLLIVSLIGVLILSNVIPYVSDKDPNLVGPWFIISMPIMILFFI